MEKVLKVNAFDVGAMEKALKECTAYKGTSVLIAEGDCVFVARDAQPAHEVDLDLCTACGLCAQLSCPAIVKVDAINQKTRRERAESTPFSATGATYVRRCVQRRP